MGGGSSFGRISGVGTASLGSSFPSLFALVVSKEVWVEDVWDSSIQEKKRCGGEPLFL